MPTPTPTPSRYRLRELQTAIMEAKVARKALVHPYFRARCAARKPGASEEALTAFRLAGLEVSRAERRITLAVAEYRLASEQKARSRGK